MCACGIENETIEHYFLRCPLFNGPRTVLLNKMNNIFQTNVFANLDDLSNIILYGDPTLDDSKNKMVLLASIQFIQNLKNIKKLLKPLCMEMNQLPLNTMSASQCFLLNIILDI